MAETYLRPDMRRMLTSDVGPLGTFMREAEMRRALRHVKFPSIRGPEGNYDFPSFQTRNKNSPAFIKWNLHSVAPHHGYSLAPHRDNHPLVDPSSGLLSAGGSRELNTEKVQSFENTRKDSAIIESLKAAAQRPQTPPRGPWCEEVDGGDVEDKWNSRKISDIAFRARFGGWTSEEKVIPKKSTDKNENLQVGNFSFDGENWKNDLAKSYMYSSVTQKNYSAVDWDKKLAQKLKPCHTTLEKRPDQISQQLVVWPMRYASKADIHQRLGPSWDRVQSREKSHGKRPYDFKSPSRKSFHIPGYGGSVGAYNFQDLDNPDAPYRPFTTLRVQKPRPSNASGKPNIPGYTGRVHWTASHSANQLNPIHSRSESALVFRQVSELPLATPYHKQGPLSKMVTTVPPQNPFNKVEKEED